MRLPENCVNARSGASIQRGSRAVVISTLIRLCILHSTNLHALRETGQVHTANCKLNFNVQNKRSSVCANLRPYRSSVTIRIRQRPKRSATQLSIIQRQMCKYTAVTNLLLFHGGEVPQRLTSHTPFLHSDGQLLQRLSPGFPLSCWLQSANSTWHNVHRKLKLQSWTLNWLKDTCTLDAQLNAGIYSGDSKGNDFSKKVFNLSITFYFLSKLSQPQSKMQYL